MWHEAAGGGGRRGARAPAGAAMDVTQEFTTAVRRARQQHAGSSATPADRLIRKRPERSPVHSAADQIVRAHRPRARALARARRA